MGFRASALIVTDLQVATLPILASTPAVLRGMLDGLPQSVVGAAGPEGWSPLDVVAHLASLQGPAIAGRVGLIAANDGAFLPNIDEEEALAASGLRGWEVGTLLEKFSDERAATVEMLRGLTPEQLARSGNHEIAGPLELVHILHHVAYHDLLHVRQLAALISAPLDVARGPMSQCFPDQG